MDRKLKTATTTLGVLAGLIALGATVYAAKNKKEIKVTNLWPGCMTNILNDKST